MNILVLELLKPYKNLRKHYIDKEVYNSITTKIWKNYTPSSGFVISDFVINHTDAYKVWLFGFDFTTLNRISWDSQNKTHNLDLEKESLLKSIKNHPNTELYS